MIKEIKEDLINGETYHVNGWRAQPLHLKQKLTQNGLWTQIQKVKLNF